jgi:hypothetical protein
MDWTAKLDAPGIAKHWANVAKLDWVFAQEARLFWEKQTPEKLEAFALGAWKANDYEGYIIARSYQALKG